MPGPAWPGKLWAWRVTRATSQPLWEWRFESECRSHVKGEIRSMSTLMVPLWALFLFVGIPTTLLWFLERQRLPGTCRSCGYSLAGLATGSKCPECGKEGAHGGYQ